MTSSTEKMKTRQAARHAAPWSVGRWTIVALVALALSPAGPVVAEETKDAEKPAASDSDNPDDTSDAQEEAVNRVLPLGKFCIKQLRPVSNETITVTFDLHLVLPAGSSEGALEFLGQWTQRLRDQVVTSVRLAETKDFSEPDLNRLQRIMLLRINRLFKTKRVESLYFTQFAFVPYE